MRSVIAHAAFGLVMLAVGVTWPFYWFWVTRGERRHLSGLDTYKD